MSNNADEAPEPLRKGQRGMQSSAAPLRDSAKNHAVSAALQLGCLIPDDTVEGSLNSQERLGINVILASPVSVGEVVVPSLELRKPPTWAL
mmetsp:Transcript_168579/g.298765  ORF Transcript_168579/g.298765 Transcript_168579/m.298765 type:complete len:91 (+) Transcript_168579:266-538(+)